MSLSLTCSISAMAPGLSTSFQAVNGAEPYIYSVVPGGAGGTIDSVTGIYTAPTTENIDPSLSVDVVQVDDYNGDTATLPISIAGPLGLFCDIIQKEMNLAPGRVFLWDQKIMQPTDSGVYVAVGVLNCKPFANTVAPDSSGSGLNFIQSVNMVATLSVDIISRSFEAVMRKEELIMALASYYSQTQQQLNSFLIAKLPVGGQFVNLSNIDGEAIPYRFNISINIQYFVRKTKSVPYFNQYSPVDIVTEP